MKSKFLILSIILDVVGIFAIISERYRTLGLILIIAGVVLLVAGLASKGLRQKQ